MIIPYTVILHEVTESIDPTTTMISFLFWDFSGTRFKHCLNSLQDSFFILHGIEEE